MNLKEYMIDYVGNKHNPENEDVTVDMVIETLAEEFPEFLLMVAEENYIRGYEQALDDVNSVKQKYGQQTTVHKKKSKKSKNK
jgi:hypothetical protein